MEKRFGKKLSQLIDAQKLDRRKVAEQAGISQSYLYKIEHEYFRPPKPVIENLARLLGLSYDELVSDTEFAQPIKTYRKVPKAEAYLEAKFVETPES